MKLWGDEDVLAMAWVLMLETERLLVASEQTLQRTRELVRQSESQLHWRPEGIAQAKGTGT